MWQIVINGPGYFDTAYELPDGVTTLGRADDNDIVLSGDLVSRKHATLSSQDGVLTLEDLSSRNGSKVNGQPVRAPVTLKAGDSVGLGENTLSVRDAPKEDEREPTQVDVFAQQDVRSSIIMSKSVSESAVLLALDNIFPMAEESSAATTMPLVPRLGTASHHLPNQPEVAYEALLLITRVAELLAKASTEDAFLAGTLDLLMRMVGASTGVILASDAEVPLRPAVVRHRGQLSQGEVPVSRTIVEEALAQGEALAVGDVRGDPRFATRESVLAYGAGQVLCIPLGQKQPFAGALYLNRPMRTAEGLESVLDVCTAVAHLLATGMEKFRAHSPRQALEVAAERAFPPGPKRVEHAKRAAGLERGPCTVLFADLSGFSAASRRVEAAEVGGLLQRFYARFVEVVWRFDGAVVSFVGDSALAVYSGGDTQKEDAQRAVHAALTLRDLWLKHEGSGPCGIKVGLHTGPALTGMVSTDKRVNYVAVGEPVNTAAWLVGLASPGQVLISGKTQASLGKRFLVSSLGEREISGRQQLTVYEVKAEAAAPTQPPVPPTKGTSGRN
jgi:class 3 adenylate cyclase/pSer/pThr/pTyr-binding forkhead associated (FHA) protein